MNVLDVITELLLEEGYSDTVDAHGMGFDYFRSIELKTDILRAFREGSGGALVQFEHRNGTLRMSTYVMDNHNYYEEVQRRVPVTDPELNDKILQFLREVK